MKKANPNPLLSIPRHLSHAMRKWVGSIVDRYEIEPQHLKVLVCAAESWDRLQEARSVISRKGISYLDRFGAPRMRPECTVERDSRIAFVRCLRELALENEEPGDDSSPRVAPTLKRKGTR